MPMKITPLSVWGIKFQRKNKKITNFEHTKPAFLAGFFSSLFLILYLVKNKLKNNIYCVVFYNVLILNDFLNACINKILNKKNHFFIDQPFLVG